MELSTIIGKTFTSIEEVKVEGLTREILFTTKHGNKFRMYHPLESTEIMAMTNKTGNLEDLLNSPITFAGKESNERDIYGRLHSPGHPLYGKDYNTMRTVYTLSTDKVTISICWLGQLTKGITHEKDDKFAEVHFNDAYELYDIPELVGKTIVDIRFKKDNFLICREMLITTNDGTKYRMYDRLGMMALHIMDTDSPDILLYSKLPITRVIREGMTGYHFFTGEFSLEILWIRALTIGISYKEDAKFGEVCFTNADNDYPLLLKPIDRKEYDSIEKKIG